MIKFNKIASFLLLLSLPIQAFSQYSDLPIQNQKDYKWFYTHGYSTPLDTIKKPNCPNGYFLQVKENYQCIDTNIIYYPKDIDKIIPGYNKLIAINLQLLEEPKWKMPKFIKRLNKLKKSETFDGYGWSPFIIVEYCYRGNYHQFILTGRDAFPKLPPRMFANKRNLF